MTPPDAEGLFIFPDFPKAAERPDQAAQPQAD